MRTRDDVLDRRPEEGARLVALDLVAEVDAAGARLVAGHDAEALHDVRVAIRRLRSTLRAYRPWLRDGVRRKDERRLRRLASATTAARDAEVQLAWLDTARAEAPRHHHAAYAWLAARLAPRRAETDGEDLLSRWDRATRRLRRRLLRFEVRLERDDGPPATLAAVLAPLVDDALASVERRVGRVRGATDRARAHRARIEGKRLRYLLEPLRGNAHADASRAVKRLKGLQDLLGELHDAHVLEAEVAEALDDVDAGDHAVRAGLHAIAERVRERRDALWAGLERARAEGAAALAAEVRAVSDALRRRAGRARDGAEPRGPRAVPRAGADGVDADEVPPPSPS